MKSVALLRGVNVGGHHKLPMADLRQWLEGSGFSSIATYIQSGNLVLEHAGRTNVARVVHDVIKEHTTWDIPVIVRSAHELAEVVTANPYPDATPTTLHVAFRAEVVPPAELANADARQWLPEDFTVRGREIYLYLPEGAGRSVMMPKLKLLRESTARNWNTVRTLEEMARD